MERENKKKETLTKPVVYPEVRDSIPHQEVEPAGASLGDQVGTDARGEQVGGGEQHGGYAPLQAAAGADRVEHDVAGHVASQVVAGVDTGGPEQSDHGTVLSSHEC